MGTPRPLRPLGGRLFALRILLFAAVVPLLLRRHLTRLAPLLEPATVPEPPPPGVVEAMVLRIDRLLLAGRPFVRSGCLTRAITLFYFLRRAGADISLRFGMGEVDGSFSGHCWVVHDGLPLAEKRDPRPLFTEMFRIPSTGTPGSTWRA
ncbi:MAG TPA: lasso peptide biosynthesis B2 protein [Thermoanaerobaculia bacterium]|nr:lasso peptide biosynthesis B2 protein [Thermoanaerobaculia bacterium]